MNTSKWVEWRPRLCFLVGVFLFATFPAPQAVAQFTVIALTGQNAPGIPGAVVISNVNDPPSFTDAGYATLRVFVSGDGINPGVNDQVIYRWRSGEGLRKVFQLGESVNFDGSQESLFFIETPTVDEQGNVAFTGLLELGERGLVVWKPDPAPNGTLHGVAVVDQAVENLIGNNVAGGEFQFNGTLETLATFDVRSAAAFRDGQVFFRGAVDPNIAPGSIIDAIWLWDSGTLTNLANEFRRVFPTDPTDTSFWDGFTNLAILRSGGLVGVANISEIPVRSMSVFGAASQNGVPTQRWHPPPGGFPEFDLRFSNFSSSMAAGLDDEPDNMPGDEQTIGIWLNTFTQVYVNTVTPATGITGGTLGTPLSQAPMPGGRKSVFAATIQGGLLDGLAGVWVGRQPGDHRLIVNEGSPTPDAKEEVTNVVAVQVGGGGHVGVHVRTKNTMTQVPGQAIFKWTEQNNLQQVLHTGQEQNVPDRGLISITGFRTVAEGFFEPRVVGIGDDGHIRAMSHGGQMGLLIEFQDVGPGEGVEPGGFPEFGAFQLTVSDLIFADGFEIGDTSLWSATQPEP